MSDFFKKYIIYIILALTAVITVSMYIYFSPYYSCKRSLLKEERGNAFLIEKFCRGQRY